SVRPRRDAHHQIRRIRGAPAAAAEALGPVRGLVMSHCESVDSSVLTTSLESWQRHFDVNAPTAGRLGTGDDTADLVRFL
ncbi:MAG: hypothetical protein ACKOVB_20025, partial [Terrabacter sp.]